MSFSTIFFTILISLLCGIGIGILATLGIQKGRYRSWLEEKEKTEVIGVLGIPEVYLKDIEMYTCPVIVVTPKSVQYSHSVGTMATALIGATFSPSISDFREIKIIGKFVDGLRLCSVSFGDRVPVQGIINVVVL